jgi:hypothetical protein
MIHPPRWTRVLLSFALPCDPMRDAILGDLHEEFVRDAEEHGARRAHIRHVSRTAGIVTHAVSDSALRRSWVSREPAAGTLSEAASTGTAQIRDVGARAVAGHVRGVAAYAGFAALALGVLVVGIVINTMLFSATEPQGGHMSPAAGIGGIALLLACVAIAAVVMCAGPRRRRQIGVRFELHRSSASTKQNDSPP